MQEQKIVTQRMLEFGVFPITSQPNVFDLQFGTMILVLCFVTWIWHLICIVFVYKSLYSKSGKYCKIRMQSHKCANELFILNFDTEEENPFWIICLIDKLKSTVCYSPFSMPAVKCHYCFLFSWAVVDLNNVVIRSSDGLCSAALFFFGVWLGVL